MLPRRPLSSPALVRLRLLLALLTLLGASACATEVGDECGSSAECGQGRLCDRSASGGYCTVSPCRVAPNTCPDESVCIEFENEETFCMATCKTGLDCREGYLCTDDAGQAPHKYCRQASRH